MVGRRYAGLRRVLLQAQQPGRGLRVQLLHGFQLAGNGTAARSDQFLQIGAGLVEMALHLLQTRAELLKLGLHGPQNGPDFARTFLDGQRPEAHLQGIEQRRHGGRAPPP